MSPVCTLALPNEQLLLTALAAVAARSRSLTRRYHLIASQQNCGR